VGFEEVASGLLAIVDGPHAAGIESPPAAPGRLHLCPKALQVV